MGVYVNKITRKSRKISGRDIHAIEYAYRCGGSMFDIDSKGRTREERLHAKLVAPTERAWKRAGGIAGTLAVHGYEDGAEVYEVNCVSYYDTGEPGEVVGHIYQSGESARFRFVPVSPRPWNVKFPGSLKYENGRHVGRHESYTRTVVALSRQRASRLVDDMLRAEGVDPLKYETRYAHIVPAS